jgi:hypothetical protein
MAVNIKDVLKEYTEFLLEEIYDKIFLLQDYNQQEVEYYNIANQIRNTYYIFSKNNINDSIELYWDRVNRKSLNDKFKKGN